MTAPSSDNSVHTHIKQAVSIVYMKTRASESISSTPCCRQINLRSVAAQGVT